MIVFIIAYVFHNFSLNYLVFDFKYVQSILFIIVVLVNHFNFQDFNYIYQIISILINFPFLLFHTAIVPYDLVPGGGDEKPPRRAGEASSGSSA